MEAPIKRLSRAAIQTNAFPSFVLFTQTGKAAQSTLLFTLPPEWLFTYLRGCLLRWLAIYSAPRVAFHVCGYLLCHPSCYLSTWLFTYVTIYPRPFSITVRTISPSVGRATQCTPIVHNIIPRSRHSPDIIPTIICCLCISLGESRPSLKSLNTIPS